MLTLLSPAKTYAPLPLSAPPDGTPALTQPLLLAETAALIAQCRALSVADVAALMKVSPPLAQLTVDRFAAFSLPFADENSVPALLAFGGEVYRGLDAASLDADTLGFAQEHLLILSGLYGVLRALDRMQPYRLEMGSRLKTARGVGLYRFWGDRITAAVAGLLETHAEKTVLNLASSEYASALQFAALPGRVITPVFQEAGPRGRAPRVVAVHAKRARGELARFVVQHRLDQPDALRDYTGGGYRLQPARSTAQEWVFVR